jgi:hypothetical protein
VETATLTPSEMGRRGGRAAQSPLGLARRLARNWPTLPADERAAILDALSPILAEVPGPIAKLHETFLLGQPKNNLAAKVPFALRYHIEGTLVAYDEELKLHRIEPQRG